MQNPLGPYGNLVAAILAVLIVTAALATHIVPGLVGDPWLDGAALMAAGVVFGTQVVQNGTQAKAVAALTLASAHESRLAALETATGQNVGHPIIGGPRAGGSA